MSEQVLSGTIKTITETQSGTSSAGKEWKKLTFVIANNGGYEGKEQIFAFDIFGAEKVDKFLQYNKVGKAVEVSYNIECKEFNGKFYTNLSAWKIFGSDSETQPTKTAKDFVEEDESLPF